MTTIPSGHTLAPLVEADVQRSTDMDSPQKRVGVPKTATSSTQRALEKNELKTTKKMEKLANERMIMMVRYRTEYVCGGNSAHVPVMLCPFIQLFSFQIPI